MFLVPSSCHLLYRKCQNIDGLERVAGITDSYLVEAHGSFSTAKCIDCAKKHSADKVYYYMPYLQIIVIHKIVTILKVKSTILAEDSEEIPTCDACGGVVKPDIVFFGEDLPARFKDLLEPDFSACDLLIVMGTSLNVQPFAGLVHRVKQTTPRLLVKPN